MNAPPSITLRLTLMFAAASALVLLLLGYLIGAAVERHFEEQDQVLLEGKMQLIRHALSTVATRANLDALPAQLNDALVGHHGLTVAVRAANGHSLFATPDAGFLLRAPLDTAQAPSTSMQTWRDGDLVYRSISAVVTIPFDAATPVTVNVATEISHHLAFMTAFRRTLWLVTFAATAVSAVLGWITARLGLAPLHDLVRVAQTVSINHLDYRVPQQDLPAELRETAQSFNEMLARLEDSFARLSDFAADLAHELRTPIGNLMVQTQVTLARARTVDDYRETLASNAEELDRLARMIADMLFLAKVDHGLMMPRHEAVDLAREVGELFEFYDAVAQEQEVRLRLDGTAHAVGDRLMLRRALSNLLSNAIRHTPRSGTITITLEQDDSGASMISVENPGPGIPPEHVPRIFDRFYRVDPARAQSADGAGLGLAITRSIVQMHDGRIDVHSRNNLTCFRITLPKRDFEAPIRRENPDAPNDSRADRPRSSASRAQG